MTQVAGQEKAQPRQPGRDRLSRPQWLLAALLWFDAAVLAVIELFFLPLRVEDVWPEVSPGWNLQLPVTIVLAGVSTPWLVAAAGQLSPRLVVAGGPLLAWILALMVLAIGGPGGDMMLIADWRSLALIAAGALPAATVLGGVIARAPIDPDPVQPGGAVHRSG